MNARPYAALLATCAVFLGCANTVSPPLLFGDHTTYGLHMGTDPASAGGSVALGYKARSLAVVPVSVLQPDGGSAAIRSKGGDPKNASRDSDALSVFAVFENQAEESGDTKPAVRLGQIFATGLAAQTITRGIRCRANPSDSSCQGPPAAIGVTGPLECAKAGATAGEFESIVERALKAHLVNACRGDDANASTLPPRTPYQSPLVFVRTDSVGINIGGSIAEQGLRFAIGADFDNVALIPPATQGGHGKYTELFANDTERSSTDAYSVLGQFKGASTTKGLNLELKRYFATGLAARNLAEALSAEIVKAAPEDAASAPSN